MKTTDRNIEIDKLLDAIQRYESVNISLDGSYIVAIRGAYTESKAWQRLGKELKGFLHREDKGHTYSIRDVEKLMVRILKEEEDA